MDANSEKGPKHLPRATKRLDITPKCQHIRICGMSASLALHICWLVVCLAFTGCVTGAGARHLSGTYVNRETGGLIVFRANGEFYYSFTTPMKTLPRNLGYYHFERATDANPVLQVRSTHYGLFSIRVSESGDRVFLTHPKLFASEQVYEQQ